MDGALVAAARRLTERLRGAGEGWFAGRPGGERSRAELLRLLVVQLAALGREGGTGVPADAVPAALGEHALGDQITVLIDDLTKAPALQEVSARAVRAVQTAYDALWVR